MTAPANLRFNLSAPFPSLVTGDGPITISKQNGIWTVGWSINIFGVQVPPVGDYPTDYLLVYDSIADAYFKMSITNLLSSIAITTGAAPNQRSVLASPIILQPTDQILNINIAIGAPTCTLPAAATRLGVPLIFKDIAGHATANNITITPAAGETIDGDPNYVLLNNYQSVTLVPFNDGVNTGWFVT